MTNLGDLNLDLTLEESSLIAGSIEVFGTGEHPVPTAEALPFFTADYVLECLEKARAASTAPDLQARRARDLIGRIASALVSS